MSPLNFVLSILFLLGIGTGIMAAKVEQEELSNHTLTNRTMVTTLSCNDSQALGLFVGSLTVDYLGEEENGPAPPLHRYNVTLSCFQNRYLVTHNEHVSAVVASSANPPREDAQYPRQYVYGLVARPCLPRIQDLSHVGQFRILRNPHLVGRVLPCLDTIAVKITSWHLE